MSEPLQGRRRANNTPSRNSQPGDYWWSDAAKAWMCVVPHGMRGSLRGHEITVHEDGTITASPSIWMTGERTWHGFLERGMWREV